MDKLAGMRMFVEIVDRGSMKAAAIRVGCSHPTVVRTFAQLEESLGVKLLNRTTRRAALTEEGRVYLEHCRRILADVDEVESGLSVQSAEPRGLVRVSASLHFGALHVAPAITVFLARHPQVRVDLELRDAVVDLLDESVDVAVRIGALPDSSMVAVPVGEVRRVVCGSADLIDRVGRPESPADLLTLPTIDLKPLLSGPNWVFRDPQGSLGKEISLRPTSVLVTNRANVAAEACAEGIGFGLLLSYQAASGLTSGALECVLEEFEPAPLPVHLVYPGARLMSSRVRVLVDALRESLRARLADLP